MANPTYPLKLSGPDELLRVVLKEQAVVLVYQQDRSAPVFQRYELGDERPVYAWSRADDCWVRVSLMRDKDV